MKAFRLIAKMPHGIFYLGRWTGEKELNYEAEKYFD
jgi:hypothetical protein